MLKKFEVSAKEWVANYNKMAQAKRPAKRLTMCRKCYAFHYKRSWHFERPMHLDESREQEVPVLFTECTACLKEEDIFSERESTFAPGLSME